MEMSIHPGVVSDARNTKKMSSKRKQKAAARLEEASAMQMPMQQEVMEAAPDPKTKITWPRHLAGSDDSKFVCIWPNNLDSKKTAFLGRRIPIEAACEGPVWEEMSEVCQFLKLTHVVEPFKSYPRDARAYLGRIKVQLKDAKGEPVDPDITTRKLLMRRMAELIPKLAIRKQRQQRSVFFCYHESLLPCAGRKRSYRFKSPAEEEVVLLPAPQAPPRKRARKRDDADEKKDVVWPLFASLTLARGQQRIQLK